MILTYIVFGVGLLIGIWALTALISALIKSGGSVQLFKGWLQAIRGK